MKFLLTLVALAIYVLMHDRSHLHRDDWFDRMWHSFDAQGGDWQLMVVLLTPVIVCQLVMYIFGGLLFGLVGAVLALFFLVWSLGRGHLASEISSFLAIWRQQDYAQAGEYARRTIPSAGLEAAGGKVLALHDAARAALVENAFVRVFHVLFWFFIFGVPGAVFVRVLYLTQERAEGDNTRRVGMMVYWTEWLPARVLALTFCLAGNFSLALEGIRQAVSRPGVSSGELLAVVAVQAIGAPESNRSKTAEVRSGDQLEAVRELLQRSLVICVAIIALGTLAGWDI